MKDNVDNAKLNGYKINYHITNSPVDAALEFVTVSCNHVFSNVDIDDVGDKSDEILVTSLVIFKTHHFS